ncbi:Reticulon-4-interacting protein 1, mitochondrial [Naviculisporaceae sp. PSN 640]
MSTTGLPKTMKSLLQPTRESTSLILTTSPLPQLTHPDDVLIRVAAAAPCNGELLWARNFPDAIPASKELVPCQDLAGTVVSAPENSGFSAGDKVYCRIEADRPGAAREYATARVRELAKIPSSLGWVEAAATPLSALTAWQALFVQGGGLLDAKGVRGDKEVRERNGKVRVLVTGAAGGVGSWAVQFASLAGAKGVVAVCGGDKESVVKELGANEVVNYRETSIEQWVGEDLERREVDLVVDMIGGASLRGCWTAVKNGGSLVSVNTPPDMVKPEGLQKEVHSLFFIVEPLGSNLAEIGELIEAGKVRPLVDSVWEFDQFEKAFERLESGHAKGKIIIKVSDEVAV